MISKVICIALLASLVFMFLYVEKIKKNAESKELEITALKKDLWDATQMEHNIEIVRFADGKYYAIVNIYHAMKSPLIREEDKKQKNGDKFILEYRADENLPAVAIDNIASGSRMLAFPIPEERKDDISFEVKKTFTEDYEGNAKTFISEDLFFLSKINEHIIRFDAKSKKVYMGKKIAEQLGYIDDGKGGLIKKE